MTAQAKPKLIVTLPSDTEIRMTREFNAPRELVFRCFTEPRLIEKWWGPRTHTTIVDKLEQWHFETGANGGFMLARGLSAPGNLQEFVDHVVPELQRRGLSKKQYAGPTLRENLLN